MNEDAAELRRELEAQELERLRAQEDERQREAIDQKRRGEQERAAPRGAIEAATDALGAEPRGVADELTRIAQQLERSRQEQEAADAKEQQRFSVSDLPLPPTTEGDSALWQEVAQLRQELEALRQRVDKIEGAGAAS